MYLRFEQAIQMLQTDGRECDSKSDTYRDVLRDVENADCKNALMAIAERHRLLAIDIRNSLSILVGHRIQSG
jgi:hypothetical protein